MILKSIKNRRGGITKATPPSASIFTDEIMQKTDLNRRAFLRGKSPRVGLNSIRPPWAIDASLFAEKCTRCDECIKVCPEKIISRGDGGYPEIDFHQGEGECTFCAKCADACESDAFIISPDDKAGNLAIKSLTPWDLQINFDTKCLSLNAVVCRTCADNCDEQAISFQLKLKGVSEPQLTQESCTGCGACVSVCPVRAIEIKPVADLNKP